MPFPSLEWNSDSTVFPAVSQLYLNTQKDHKTASDPATSQAQTHCLSTFRASPGLQEGPVTALVSTENNLPFGPNVHFYHLHWCGSQSPAGTPTGVGTAWRGSSLEPLASSPATSWQYLGKNVTLVRFANSKSTSGEVTVESIQRFLGAATFLPRPGLETLDHQKQYREGHSQLQPDSSGPGSPKGMASSDTFPEVHPWQELVSLHWPHSRLSSLSLPASPTHSRNRVKKPLPHARQPCSRWLWLFRWEVPLRKWLEGTQMHSVPATESGRTTHLWNSGFGGFLRVGRPAL